MPSPHSVSISRAITGHLSVMSLAAWHFNHNAVVLAISTVRSDLKSLLGRVDTSTSLY
ncbi:retrovirus-related pol polyprotein from transposon [Moniliophthora roreri]|nr:retrovirus-related pol polyprotein from transposon [Moniliophthora roreri]